MVGQDAGWAHKVAAADRTDPDLTQELATEAELQAQAGRINHAATLLLWAAGLSPTRVQYEHHLITAATHLCMGQAWGRAQNLRQALQGCAPTARRDAVLGHIIVFTGEDPHTAEDLLAHARDTAPDTATRLLAGSWLGHALLQSADAPRAAAALRPVVDQLPPGNTSCFARGLLGTAASHMEPVGGLKVIAEAGLPERASQVTSADSPLLVWRGSLRTRAGRLAAGTDDLTTVIDRQRTDPGIPPAYIEFYLLAFAYHLTGRFQDAVISAEQSLLLGLVRPIMFGAR
ncbi:hypothetical protein [Streptomyces sp. NPDC126514]|uniref:hypothetical protein n=1 Tax=Streptomyces sp. NPDC126514 TaxID=3155210 RepID=UPI00332BF5C5